MENENIGKIVQSSRILSFFLEMMRETLGEFISIVFICKKNDVLLLDKKKKKFLFLDRMEFILYAVVN